MAKKTSKKTNEKPNLFKRIKIFFRSLTQEIKKVSWSDAKTLRQNTATVLAIIFIAAFTIWLFDLAIQTALTGVGFYKTKQAAPLDSAVQSTVEIVTPEEVPEDVAEAPADAE